ncbi:MAG: hypothetical protein RIT02_2991 [Planctomycetota bacterium]
MAEANGCCPERGHRTAARWFHPGGRGCRRAAKRGRARLLPSRETWEGEAPAEPWEPTARRVFRLSGSFALPKGRPDRCFGSAGASPSRRGGQTGVSAQRELRPPEGAARQVFGSAGASPSRRGGQTGVRLSGSFALPKGRPDRCSAQQELRPPEGAARQPFGSAGASPSRRGDTRGKPICSCAQDFALIRIVWGRVGARRPQTSGPLCEFDCVPLLSIARGWPCEQGRMLMVRG